MATFGTQGPSAFSSAETEGKRHLGKTGLFDNMQCANRQSHYENLQPGPVKGSGGCREAADIHLPGAADRSRDICPSNWQYPFGLAHGEAKARSVLRSLLLQRFKAFRILDQTTSITPIEE